MTTAGPMTTATPHTIPRRTFLALARGRGGADAVAVLRAGQLSKRRLLLSAVRRAAEARRPDEAREVRLAETYEEFERIRQRSREQWESVLLQPYLDLWAADCLRRLHADEAPAQAQDQSPAQAQDQSPAQAQPPAQDQDQARAQAPAQDQDQAPDQDQDQHQHPHRPEDTDRDRLRGLAGFLRPTGHVVRLEAAGHRLVLRIDDRGPYRHAHGEPVPGPLGEDELRAWRELLAEAWRLLAERHPWYAEAVGAGVSTLVPLRPPPDGTAVSSAVRRGYGAIGVSLPSGPQPLALALVHEFLHIQLGALLDLVPLHGPDSGARYHAPWRPDPRPAGALLQGTYAHLGVSDFWRREPGAHAAEQYAHWRGRTLEAADTLLESGELTEDGREFVVELRRAVCDR
ncbi:HEXXH motif-containing putative peptide modification protein [Streptomyces sp. NPDC006678]|uniref:aKG-HExxH-type peptide beta-hydroxylase n=1 Tax=Streptomyces sp. NPDC006678 TaxID=3157185 RepID=UPI0033E27F67